MKPCTVLLLFALFSCTNPQKPAADQPLTEAEQKAKLAQVHLDFDPPVLIDSSDYVLYPLPVHQPEKIRGGFSSGSYSIPNTDSWNIVFYNPSTGEYHLLEEQRKMLIQDYTIGTTVKHSAAADSREQSAGGTSPLDKLIYYFVTTLDLNQDGELNHDDPTYLFISDQNGRNLKQISPDSLDVTNWRTLRETNKILIQTTKDSNGDKKFDEKDETLPLVYDLRTGEYAREIFQADFKVKLKKQLDEQWKKE